MKVVIRITQKIKDQNNHAWVQSAEIGDKVVRNNYPSKFYVTGDYRVTGDYDKPRFADLRFADGWRPLIPRVDLDLLLFRENRNNLVKFPEGATLPNTTHYEYKVIALTQAEIDANLLQAEDKEDESDVNFFKNEGENLVQKTRKRLTRRIKKGLINLNESEKTREEIFDAFVRLSFGSWDLAKNFADAIPTHNNPNVENEIQWFRNQIDTFITDNL